MSVSPISPLSILFLEFLDAGEITVIDANHQADVFFLDFDAPSPELQRRLREIGLSKKMFKPLSAA